MPAAAMTQLPPETKESMSSSDKRRTDPQLRVDDDDALTFPADAEPTDDTPTIISKTHPTVEPKTAATSENVTDLAARGQGADNLGGNLRGRRLAHFELIEPIGVGGMAAVLRARDTQLDRQVALKILPPDMAADPENVRRFHQEAKAAARLDHENIARVFFCGEDQGLHFIAFEFVEGENLRTLLERRGRLPVAEAVRYVLQIATGLEHASSRGVVHRDVKPSNIIISPNGRAKLVDMGLARNMERRGDADLTQSGVTLGTFDYISPEQALEPRDADARSDIYSLGCTFYHMVTGQPPVPDGTAAKKLHHHQHVAPVDPRQLNPEIPDEIAMILGRMMHKDPRARYQRPLQLVQHLMQVARKVGAADDLPEGVLFVDAPLPTGPRSRPLVIVALPFLALGMLIAILAFPWNEQSPTTTERPVSTAQNSPGESKKPGGTQADVSLATAKPPPGEDAAIYNASDLEAVLTDASIRNRQTVKLEGVIDVKKLTVHGDPARPLTFTSNDVNNIATLRFKAESPESPVGLTVEAGKVIFNNVKFQVSSDKNWEQAVAAIAVRGARSVVFKKCVFEQPSVPQKLHPDRPGIAAVLIETSPGSPTTIPTVEFSECTFGDEKGQNIGQVAVAVNGPALVRATDCSFRLLNAFFQLRGGCRLAATVGEPSTVVQIDRCSAQLANGPVFGIEANAGAELSATNCMFSWNEDKIRGPDPNLILTNLILQSDRTPIRFLGANNGYHHLNALWSDGRDNRGSRDQFQALLASLNNGSKDENAKVMLELSPSPWYTQQTNAATDVAFQLKPEYSTYGLRAGPWGALAQVQTTEPSLAANQKLFDPDYKGATSSTIFSSLKAALPSLKPGDELLIKPGKDGREIPFPSTSFEEPIDITIKAFPNTAPVLTLAAPKKPQDVAFFRLPDGKLKLEGLHFVLEPRKTSFGTLSVIQVGYGALCSFERCVVTLRSNGGTIPLNVVALMGAKDLEMMAKPGATPQMSSRVEFVNSLVRGDGDLANLDLCRRLSVSMRNSLVALSGSLVDVDVRSEEPGAELAGPLVELDHASIFSREPVFTLSTTRTGKVLGTTHVKCQNSVLGALAKRPLVYLKASEVMSEQQLGKYLEWDGKQNLYVRFDKLLEHELPDEKGTTMQLTTGEWGKLFGETMSEVVLPALGDANLWEIVPERFRVADTDSGCSTLAELDPLIKAMPAR
jgi:serine/threonine protein kinase